MNDHAISAASGTRNHRLATKKRMLDLPRTIRAATLYLIGLLAIASLFPMPVRMLAGTLVASLILSLIGIGASAWIWFSDSNRARRHG